jgi:hypothetical protein
MSRGDICAMCEHFTLEGGKPDEGIGRCLGYGETNPEQLVRWDRQFSVLFGPAPNMSKRMQWIRQQESRENNNQTEGVT